MTTFSQIFPPSPTFTEKDLPDLSSKVYIITGATSGVGLALCKLLHPKNPTLYLGARSLASANKAIEHVKAACPASRGRLEPLVMDLADLGSVKGAVEEYATREKRLQVLVLNAGIMMPPPGSKTKAGHDLEMGTNCLGPFLLNKLLEPILRQTAAEEPPNSVRVVWVSSMLNAGVPKGGVLFDDQSCPKQLKGMDNYMQTKAGDALLASECAKRLGRHGILCVSLHPGFLMTELQRHMPAMQRKLLSMIFKTPQYGALTELYAAFSPDVTAEDNGAFFIPWGRRGAIPAHMVPATKTKSEGGTEGANRFYEWCERETKSYV